MAIPTFNPGEVLKAEQLNALVNEANRTSGYTLQLNNKIDTLSGATESKLNTLSGATVSELNKISDDLEALSGATISELDNISDDLNTLSGNVSTMLTDLSAYTHSAYTYDYTLHSFAEGNETTASGQNSHAEGKNTQALGFSSHAEGNETTASGNYSHAEGKNTQAIGNSSHSEGEGVSAIGLFSHAEGICSSGDSINFKLVNIENIEASDTLGEDKMIYKSGSSFYNKIFIRNNNDNSIDYSIDYIKAKYYKKGCTLFCTYRNVNYEIKIKDYKEDSSGITITLEENVLSIQEHEKLSISLKPCAIGADSHIEGQNTTAFGDNSHASGAGTIAHNHNEFVCGYFNEDCSGKTIDSQTYNKKIFVVGNGNINDRTDAFVVDENGIAYVTTQLYVEETPISTTGSDERIKENLKDIDIQRSYDLIESARTVNFNFIGKEKEEVGTIAQDVINYFPEVIYNRLDGYYSLDYSKLTVPLMQVVKDMNHRLVSLEKTVADNSKTIKSQQKTITTLNSTIATLNETISELSSRVEALEEKNNEITETETVE